ncbi:MAG: RNA-binding S4 domain-containing protein [Bacteroidaceae bacterium]|nr:RNA-binding S4 domain-containing protein [Bacteroidaceae bacterium]
MSELDEWQDNNNSSAEKNENEGGREGYRSFNRESNGGQRPRFSTNGGGNGDRPRRPRFNSSERGYNSNNNQQGFRPEGFGRSSGNNGGYGQRPYNNRNSFGGGNGYDDQGGYRPRQNSFSQGYRQGNNDGGYNNQRGGYNNQRGGGYNNQRGGYNNQRGGGYNNQRGGYNNQRGGYNNQRGGGYNNQRGGGFGGGYNNQRNQGFKQRGGGYNPNAKYSQKKRIEYKEYIEDPDAPIRLNKFLANAGVCSRREADQFIQAGVVKVNGEIVTELGTKVQRTDTIHFHDQLVTLEKKVYVILNKPKDYVTTSDDPQQRKTVMELVKDACRERIYPVGRLDRNTTGVLLFTNDGDLASKLTHPKFLKKKIYHVYLDHNATAADLKQIADGITLEDGEVHADAISYASDTDKKQVGIEIHSGKNRIVRRIFESLGYRVLKLDRVMFAGLTKKGLKRGDWRYLTEQEVAMLHMGSFE